jgi:hypothetical protein
MKSFVTIVIFTLFSMISINANAQINEPTSNEVYAYLYRMSQKGLIDFRNYILPLDRATIYEVLQHLSNKQNELSQIERKELSFYNREFKFDNKFSGDTTMQSGFLKRDKGNRFRTVAFSQNSVQIFADPFLGTSYSSTNKGYNLTYFNGIRLSGKLGKNWGFSFLFRDVNEKGDSINFTKDFTNARGIVNAGSTTNQLNYSEINFNLAYKWSNGVISVGKENMVWGFGNNANMILSDKSPSFPYIRLDYKPFKWLHFNYMHGWLASNIIDSNRTYNTGSGTYGGVRQQYVSKFFATHSITITPKKGLDISIGESIVYSDKFDVGYLMPINFFKSYDQWTSNQNINAGSNAQFFGQISSKNHLKNTHLYAQIFIDEIKISSIFNKVERRNQLGYLFGINVTDVGLKYLSLGAEYSRINPFVYNNLTPAQTYTNSGYSLGDWMGSNADRLNLFFSYTPIARLKIRGNYQFIRKGGLGTIQQQYLQQPQPDFLFDPLFNMQKIELNIIYELVNALKIGIIYTNDSIKYSLYNKNSLNNSVLFSFSYGL